MSSIEKARTAIRQTLDDVTMTDEAIDRAARAVIDSLAQDAISDEEVATTIREAIYKAQGMWLDERDMLDVPPAVRDSIVAPLTARIAQLKDEVAWHERMGPVLARVDGNLLEDRVNQVVDRIIEENGLVNTATQEYRTAMAEAVRAIREPLIARAEAAEAEVERLEARADELANTGGDTLAVAQARIAQAEAENAELRRTLDKVRELSDRHEKGATRWADPLTVPEWIVDIRAILDAAPEGGEGS